MQAKYKKLIKPRRKALLCALLINLCYPAYSISKTAAVKEIKAEHNDTNDLIGKLLLQSVSLIGIPYKWGGNSPATGLDCSGFIHYIYKKTLGLNLPRTAAQMAELGKNVPLNQLQPGDLLFFNTLGGEHISHIGMYLGNNQFIQSPHTGDRIKITTFNAYYHSKFVVAKRMVEEDFDNNGTPTLLDIRNDDDGVPVKSVKTTTKEKTVTKKHYKTKKSHRHTIKNQQKNKPNVIY